MSEQTVSPDLRMSISIERRSPVEEGTRTLDDGTRMTLRTGGALLQLLSRPGSVDEAWLRQRLDAPSPVDLRHFSPGQWLLVSNDALDQAAIAHRLRDMVDLVDQSHGRIRLELAGPNVQAMLGYATGLDLHAGLAASTTTLLGHIGVNVTRMGPDVYELIVLRSFVESLVEEIERMCALPARSI
jgi:sarcosine oxidase subunit gamma